MPRMKLSPRPVLKIKGVLISTIVCSFLIVGVISFVLPLLKSEQSKAEPLYMSFESGTYVGDGVNGRRISGLSFQPSMVMIKAEASYYASITTADMPVGYSKNSGGPTAIALNGITALNADGFSVGTANEVNRAGTVYHWVAMGSGTMEMQTGKYTGNSTTGRQITGLSFTPDLVWIFGAGATNNFLRTVFMPVNMAYSMTGSGNSSRITNFVSNGFELGNSSDVNGTGTEYYYVAFKSNVNTAYVGSYTGNATNNRLISGTPFLNDFILIKPHASADTRWKTSTVGGTVSLRMSSSYSASETSILNLGNGVFTVSNNNLVNENGTLHSYLAFKKSSGSALPVEMLDFTAKAKPSENIIELNWRTSVEVNNDYYSVLRSVEGQNFNVIGRVEGNGTTSNLSSYQFIDKFPPEGTVYYKLHQFDYNGNNKLYGPVVANYRGSSKKESKIAIHPNPFNDRFEITLSGDEEDPAFKVCIFNSAGSMVYQDTFENNFDNIILIDNLSHLPSGTYIVKVDGKEKTIGSRSLIKI